jgi:uncharacterized protein YfcZ (UPF0381/DUF406 family)
MKHLNSYEKYTESLKISQFRKYVKEFNKDRYLDIFKQIGDRYEHDKNYYRVYIPLGKEIVKVYISDIHKEIDNFLKNNDCRIIDYVKGSAKFNNSKNETTIGKILFRLKNKDLMNKFVSDEKRKILTSTNTDDLFVCISRHPYDIAGSDSDRNWTNCMTIGTDKSNRLTKLMVELERAKKSEFEKDIKELEQKIKDYKEDGVNVKYLIHEVKEGSLVSYLIRRNDKNINNPLGVLNIKPYQNAKGKTNLYSSNSMYGIKRDDFKNTVDEVLSVYFNKDSGKFKINNKVYNDGDASEMINTSGMSIDEICEIYDIKNYTINSDGSIDVNGNVNLCKRILTNERKSRLPISFRNVTGSFDCSYNKLTTLEGCPKNVGGDFICKFNELTTLEGSPEEVGKNFECGYNQLSTLEGSPKKINGNFDCCENKLTTLKGAPEEVGKSFIAERNNLRSLDYIPSYIGGSCSLTSNNFDWKKIPSVRTISKIIGRVFIEEGDWKTGGR